jgi:hypothetical protein
MRIVYDINGKTQTCGSRHGSLISLTSVEVGENSDAEIIHIDGDPKYIIAMLEEMLEQARSLAGAR